jgi:hypothetical protein
VQIANSAKRASFSLKREARNPFLRIGGEWNA